MLAGYPPLSNSPRALFALLTGKNAAKRPSESRVRPFQTALTTAPDRILRTKIKYVNILNPSSIAKGNAMKTPKYLTAQLPTKQAAALAAEICGENKKSLYDAALAWK